jgi:UDPglucose 6-dehydrogenase
MGSEASETMKALEEFYVEFHYNKLPAIIRTTHENAELIKYANNAFLATKVSFINCIGNIAEPIPGADIKVIAAGIGLDARIGSQFLNAGLGWGGSCLPKDLDALLAFSRASGYNPELIQAVIDTNRKQWRKMAEAAKRALGSLSGKRVAVLGFSFKPSVDDIRDAISTLIV